MKILYKVLFVFILSTHLLGCSSGTPGEKPGMEGYVTSIESGRMLVVDSTSKDFSSTGGVEEFYNAIWFSNAPNNVEVGDKVKVWFDVVAESYPGQSEAKNVEIVESDKPKGAELTEAGAIRKSFETLDTEYKGVTVIKEVSYDNNTDTWDVVVKQESEEMNINVKDK